MKACRGTEDFITATNKEGLVVAEFGSFRCPPCRDLRRKIELWLERHPEAEGIYVPIEECPEIAAQNDVFSSPTVRLYVNGRMTVSESGYFSLDIILSQAERYISLLS